MKRHWVYRPTSQTVFALCAVSAAVASLSFPGCVRSPREFISGLGGDVSNNTGMVPPSETNAKPGAEPDLTAQAEQPLISSPSETSIQQVSHQTQESSSDPVATKPESENLLGTILKKRRHEQDVRVAAADPFRDAARTEPAKSAATVSRPPSRRKSTVAGQPAANPDRSSNRFANGFDARMAAIRKDLNSREQSVIATADAEEGSTDLPLWALPSQTNPSDGMSRPGTSQSESTSGTQVQSLEDGLFGNPVLAARDESPAAVPATNSHERTPPATERSRETTDWSGEVADAEGSVTSPTPDSPVVNWADVNQAEANADGRSSEYVEQTVAFSRPPMISSGGVKLLPPIEDDGPTDFSQTFSRKRTHSEPGEESTASAVASIDRSSRVDISDLLRTWKDSEKQDARQTGTRAETLRPLPPLSADKREMLTNAAANRTRVLEADSENWPQFSSPNRAATEQDDREPIQVAMAPPISLERGATLSVNTSSGAGRADRRGASDTNPGSGWIRQMPWFVGGILLLIIAIRLTARRSKES